MVAYQLVNLLASIEENHGRQTSSKDEDILNITV